MKEVTVPKQVYTVELSRAEVEFLRGVTENPLYETEDPETAKTRLGLFVGTSRLLGYNMTDAGSIVRGTRPGENVEDVLGIPGVK